MAGWWEILGDGIAGPFGVDGDVEIEERRWTPEGAERFALRAEARHVLETWPDEAYWRA